MSFALQHGHGPGASWSKCGHERREHSMSAGGILRGVAVVPYINGRVVVCEVALYRTRGTSGGKGPGERRRWEWTKKCRTHKAKRF